MLCLCKCLWNGKRRVHPNNNLGFDFLVRLIKWKYLPKSKLLGNACTCIYFYNIIRSVDMALKHVYLHRHHKMYFINIGLLVVFSEKLHVFLMKAMPCCGPLIIGAILLHGTTTNIYLIVAFTVMKRHTVKRRLENHWNSNLLIDIELLSPAQIRLIYIFFNFHQ